jgi:hypothetical protein
VRPVQLRWQLLRLQAETRILVAAVLLRQPLPPLRQRLLLRCLLQRRCLREAMLRQVLPMW